jgi:hypothetical protein
LKKKGVDKIKKNLVKSPIDVLKKKAKQKVTKNPKVIQHGMMGSYNVVNGQMK